MAKKNELAGRTSLESLPSIDSETRHDRKRQVQREPGNKYKTGQGEKCTKRTQRRDKIRQDETTLDRTRQNKTTLRNTRQDKRITRQKQEKRPDQTSQRNQPKS